MTAIPVTTNNGGHDPQGIRLSQVHLRWFKAAFRPSPVTLRPFNIVIGRNGSGKSTLIEALQWIDTTLRRDAHVASERYFGVSDLVNLRSTKSPPSFIIDLQFSADNFPGEDLQYSVEVADRFGDGSPAITRELLRHNRGQEGHVLIETLDDGSRVVKQLNARVFQQDRLALANGRGVALPGTLTVDGVFDFWARAVFLRLSPNRLSKGSSATRSSSDPILDEEGQTLPALLFELTRDQRAELVERVRGVLDNFEEIELRQAQIGRDTQVNYALKERMPYRGRNGSFILPVPSWMLSEGTRRITAILALLVRNPRPSILGIEEIENGLDPWVTLRLVDALRDAANEGTQVILTTHSPWLLDNCNIDDIISVRRTQGDTRYERFRDLEAVREFDPRIPPGTRYVNLSLGIDDE